MDSCPLIQVIIPYKPERKLAEAYNDAFENCAADWICFIDHDVMMITPSWYTLMLDCIAKYGHSAGWISCVTNRIGCHWQKAGNYHQIPPADDDLMKHIDYAKSIFPAAHTYYEPAEYAPFSGFCILTHRQAWKDAGGFDVGNWNCDNPYSDAILRTGYKRVIITGLYAYHLYTSKGRWLNA